MSELKPCPFCGEKATLDYGVLPNRKHWFITCDCCGMMYQYTLSQRKYVKDGWNTRPIEDALQAENERLKEELQCEKTRSQLNLEAEERRMLNITHYCAEIDRLTARIAELEAEIERLTAHSDIERQDDKWIPEVQE